MDVVITHTWILGQKAHGLSLNRFPEPRLYSCQQQTQCTLKEEKTSLPSSLYPSAFFGKRVIYSHSSVPPHDVGRHASSCASVASCVWVHPVWCLHMKIIVLHWMSVNPQRQKWRIMIEGRMGEQQRVCVCACVYACVRWNFPQTAWTEAKRGSVWVKVVSFTLMSATLALAGSVSCQCVVSPNEGELPVPLCPGLSLLMSSE